MFSVDYSFDGRVEYRTYNEIVDRIMEFNNWKLLGLDESGMYGIYGIIVGDPYKPAIFINGGAHGNEYHTIEPIINTLKMIEDREHPDKELNDKILENYCIVSIPMLNPYGVTRNSDNPNGVYGGRFNYNGADLNRNFGDFLQAEQRIIRDFFNKFKPFSFADFHMFGPTWSGVSEGKFIAVDDVHDVMDDYMLDWVESLENATGIPSEMYDRKYDFGKPDFIRSYFAMQSNPYTPVTLGVLLEHAYQAMVDGVFVENINREDQWNAISLNVTFFLKYSIIYFEENGDFNALPVHLGDLITEIENEHKNVKVVRNQLGVVKELIEDFGNTVIRTEFLRDSQNKVTKIVREKKTPPLQSEQTAN